MHYVLVLALYSLDKSASLVTSDLLAAIGLSGVHWLILRTAGQMGLLCIAKLGGTECSATQNS